MREMKFRAWSKTKGKMIYAAEAKHSSDLLAIGLHGLPIAVDRDSFQDGAVVGWNIDHCVTLMQYTGLKDKNGREIYEGDILSLGKRVGVVQWYTSVENGAGFFISTNSERDYKVHHAWTVIGNIYQNPEMQASPLQGDMAQQGGQ